MGCFDRLLDYMRLNEEAYEDEEHGGPGGQGDMEVVMVRSFTPESAAEICDCLLSGKAVVMNMESVPMQAAQRFIDVVSGAVYCLGGSLQKVSGCIFIAAPDGVDLSGDFQDILANGPHTVPLPPVL